MNKESEEKKSMLYEYHKHNLMYISDYIKFADTKAGVALGANLLMLGFYGQQLKKTDSWSLFLKNDIQLMLMLLVISTVLTLIFSFYIFDFIVLAIQQFKFTLNFNGEDTRLFLIFYSIVSSVTIAINTSIFTTILIYEKEHILISSFQYKETILILFLIIGLMFLVVSCYYLLLKVLWPRYSLETDYYMSWGGISSFNNVSDYIQKLDLVDSSTFINDMAKQNHALSKVCADKYINLQLGFRYLIIGASLTSLCWFLIEIK